MARRCLVKHPWNGGCIVWGPDESVGQINLPGVRWDPIQDIQDAAHNVGQEIKKGAENIVKNTIVGRTASAVGDALANAVVTPPTDAAAEERLKKYRDTAAMLRGIADITTRFPGRDQLMTANDVKSFFNYGLEIPSLDSMEEAIKKSAAAKPFEEVKKTEEEEARLKKIMEMPNPNTPGNRTAGLPVNTRKQYGGTG